MTATIDLISEAFLVAQNKYPDLLKIWIDGSHHLGKKLPKSLLSSSIQKGGTLDLVLRSIEDEYSPETLENNPLSIHYHSFLAELWIGHVYEIFRILKNPQLGDISKDIVDVAYKLELVRIPLEKHELPKDHKLKQPLLLERYPPMNDATDIHRYSSSDPLKSHIMPSGISGRGSMTWNVIDVVKQESFWVERRALSDAIIHILKVPKD